MTEQILSYIIQYISEHGYPPTFREIGDGVGLKSTSSVQSYMEQLRASGKIETDATEGMSRAIRVPGYKFVPIK